MVLEDWCNLFGYKNNKRMAHDDCEITAIFGFLLLPFLGFMTVLLRTEMFTRYLIPVDGVNFPVCYPRIGRNKTVVNWAKKRLPQKWSSKSSTLSGGIGDFWKDGSLFCTLINSAIPGACSNPYRHWMNPPMHAQEVVHKYLGIAPIFSEEDFSSHLTYRLERRLLKYLILIYKSINAIEKEKIFLKTVGSTFVAKGMGLYTAQKSREAEFFIYSKYNKIQFFNLQIEIRGPHLSHYKTNVLDYLANEFRRNNFFKKPPGSISLKVDVEKDRLRIVYVSKFDGIHEIFITSNNEIVVGSPFYVNVMNYTKNTDLNHSLNNTVRAENKNVLNTEKPLKISKYLKNLNILSNKEALCQLKSNLSNCNIYFAEESYSSFQKFANSCFRIPCKITRASPVFCNSPIEFCSASPVCRKHIDPEDFDKQKSTENIQEYLQAASSSVPQLKPGYTLDSSFQTLKNTKDNINRRNQLTINASDKLVQSKKLFWERAFNNDESDSWSLKSDKHFTSLESRASPKTSNKSLLYSKLKHVDSLYLLRKRPVSKSLIDWRKSDKNKKLQARRSLDGNLDLCSKISLENRLNNYVNHAQFTEKAAESKDVKRSTNKIAEDPKVHNNYGDKFK